MTGDQLPLGERQDVTTFTVKDRTGTMRARGLGTEAEALRLANSLADDPAAAPLTVERVNYVAFTHREVIHTIEAPAHDL